MRLSYTPVSKNCLQVKSVQSAFFCFLTAVVCFVSLSATHAHAAEIKTDGLAMHGQPKYGINNTHLDYANPSAPHGGDYKAAIIGTFDSLNPYAIRGTASSGLHLFYDRLMARVWDEPFTMYPLIAKEAIVAHDHSAVTFVIDENARFHDGTPITALDVRFSFETLREHGRPNMRQVYDLVETVAVENDRRIHFDLKDGYDRETVMILAMMPVLSKNWWEGRKFDSSVLDIPNGNGPYFIKSVDPGREIVFERNPGYWARDHLTNAGHNNFDTVTFEYYRDETAAYEAFRAGQLSIWRENDASRWSDLLEETKAGAGIKVRSVPHQRPEKVKSIIFNMRRSPFDDIRVRKAFNLAFDAEWVNENLFHGLYKRIDSFFPNSELAASASSEGKPEGRELDILYKHKKNLPGVVFEKLYRPPMPQNRSEYRQNLREASRLLQDAGWIVNNGRRVHRESGKPLNFEILLNNPDDEKIVLAFARNLESLGIKPQIRMADTATFRGRLNDYDFDMVVYHWLSSLSPGTEQILYWGCESAGQKARWNFSGICNPAVDALARDIAFTETREDLVTSIRALDRILMSQVMMIPLFYQGSDWIAYHNHLKGPEQTPLYGHVWETWWVEKN